MFCISSRPVLAWPKLGSFLPIGLPSVWAGHPPDWLLLYLAWLHFPPRAPENAIVLAIVTFMELAWSTWAKISDLSTKAVRSAVDAAAAAGHLPSIFNPPVRMWIYSALGRVAWANL